MERELGIPVGTMEKPGFDKKGLVEGKPPDCDRLKGDES